MGTLKQNETDKETIGTKRVRYLAYTDNLMMAVIDFNDGPTNAPDPPHDHPHEQVTYVAAGEILFFFDGVPTRLGPGDMYTVPPNIPHSIQLLTDIVCKVKTSFSGRLKK